MKQRTLDTAEMMHALGVWTNNEEPSRDFGRETTRCEAPGILFQRGIHGEHNGKKLSFYLGLRARTAVAKEEPHKAVWDAFEFKLASEHHPTYNEAVEKLPRSCSNTRSAAREFGDGEIPRH